MKRKLFLSILIVFFTTSFMSIVGCNNQNIIKEQSSLSELQEQCGKQSEEYFNKEYGNGTINTKMETTDICYTNHYNKKLNKCFILIKSTQIFKDNENKIENIKMKTYLI